MPLSKSRWKTEQAGKYIGKNTIQHACTQTHLHPHVCWAGSSLEEPCSLFLLLLMFFFFPGLPGPWGGYSKCTCPKEISLFGAQPLKSGAPGSISPFGVGDFSSPLFKDKNRWPALGHPTVSGFCFSRSRSVLPRRFWQISLGVSLAGVQKQIGVLLNLASRGYKGLSPLAEEEE